MYMFMYMWVCIYLHENIYINIYMMGKSRLIVGTKNTVYSYIIIY